MAAVAGVGQVGQAGPAAVVVLFGGRSGQSRGRGRAGRRPGPSRRPRPGSAAAGASAGCRVSAISRAWPRAKVQASASAGFCFSGRSRPRKLAWFSPSMSSRVSATASRRGPRPGLPLLRLRRRRPSRPQDRQEPANSVVGSVLAAHGDISPFRAPEPAPRRPRPGPGSSRS